MSVLVVRDVEVDGIGGTDVLIRDGVVAVLGSEVPVPASADVVDGRGGALLPGLHDHHIHLHALAADRTSVRCGPPAVHTADDLARALATAAGNGWIRGVGYSEDVAGLLDLDSLDMLHAERPVRIQHRSGAVYGDRLNAINIHIVHFFNTHFISVENKSGQVYITGQVVTG